MYPGLAYFSFDGQDTIEYDAASLFTQLHCFARLPCCFKSIAVSVHALQATSRKKGSSACRAL